MKLEGELKRKVRNAVIASMCMPEEDGLEGRFKPRFWSTLVEFCGQMGTGENFER